MALAANLATTGLLKRLARNPSAAMWREAWRRGVIAWNPLVEIGLFAWAGAPTNGSSGTLAGIANPGTVYINTNTETRYTNTGTKASPTWTAGSAGYY